MTRTLGRDARGSFKLGLLASALTVGPLAVVPLISPRFDSGPSAAGFYAVLLMVFVLPVAVLAKATQPTHRASAALVGAFSTLLIAGATLLSGLGLVLLPGLIAWGMTVRATVREGADGRGPVLIALLALLPSILALVYFLGLAPTTT